MIRSFFAGARRAIDLWPLALGLWLIDGLFGLAFALASGAWLASALDGSLATRSLLKDLDPDFLVDLYLYHGESMRMLLIAGAFLALGHVTLWIWLHAVVVAAVRGGVEGEEMRRAWGVGFGRATAFTRLFGLAAIALAAFSAAVGGGAWLALRWVAASPSAWIDEAIVGGAGAVWITGAVLLVAVHDHARIRVFAGGQTAWRTYRWAWRFVVVGGRRAFWLAVALQACGGALWVGYQLVGLRFPVGEVLGVTGSLLWGEAFLAARVWLRVWAFASQSELQG